MVALFFLCVYIMLVLYGDICLLTYRIILFVFAWSRRWLCGMIVGVGGKYWDKQGWQRPVHIILTGASKNQKSTSKITTNSSNSTTPLRVLIFSPLTRVLRRTVPYEPLGRPEFPPLD